MTPATTATTRTRCCGARAAISVTTCSRRTTRRRILKGPGALSPRSELPAVSRGQDDLGHDIWGQAEFVSDLLRPQSLLVVEKRQFLLRLAPRAARRRAWCRGARGRAALSGRSTVRAACGSAG